MIRTLVPRVRFAVAWGLIALPLFERPSRSEPPDGGRIVAQAPTTPPAEGTDAPAAAKPVDERKLSAEEQQLFEATNTERTKARLPPLKIDPALLRMGREQSRLMADAGQISHAVNGQTFTIRMQAAKYPAQSAGENCAAGQETPAAAVAGWMLSPGHKANLLNPEFQELGVGITTSKTGVRYYTQVFGRRFAPAGPVLDGPSPDKAVPQAPKPPAPAPNPDNPSRPGPSAQL